MFSNHIKTDIARLEFHFSGLKKIADDLRKVALGPLGADEITRALYEVLGAMAKIQNELERLKGILDSFPDLIAAGTVNNGESEIKYAYFRHDPSGPPEAVYAQLAGYMERYALYFRPSPAPGFRYAAQPRIREVGKRVLITQQCGLDI